MKSKKVTEEIIKILKEYYPDAECSLDFTTPFEMMVAVMLSAQCTDERVNKTTPKNIEEFLVEMKGILLDANFNPERDFVFQEEYRLVVMNGVH